MKNKKNIYKKKTTLLNYLEENGTANEGSSEKENQNESHEENIW